MSYEILKTVEGLSIIHITATNVNSNTDWRVEFDNGKETTLYRHREEWHQYNEQWLDEITLIAIGNCIETSLVTSSTGLTADCFFYDMLVN